MIVAPGVTEPNGVCARTIDSVNIYPTLADLCGLPIPEHLEGRSVASLLQDPQAPWGVPALTTYGRNNHAVRTERWRYIRYADGSEELYDHQADPEEWTNLAVSPQAVEIKQSLARWLPQTNAPERSPGGSASRYATPVIVAVTVMLIGYIAWRWYSGR
jgi:arylsulfatase A-like enzyme